MNKETKREDEYKKYLQKTEKEQQALNTPLEELRLEIIEL